MSCGCAERRAAIARAGRVVGKLAGRTAVEAVVRVAPVSVPQLRQVTMVPAAVAALADRFARIRRG